MDEGGGGDGGVRGETAAAAGAEVCTEGSRSEEGPRWWKETFCSL